MDQQRIGNDLQSEASRQSLIHLEDQQRIGNDLRSEASQQSRSLEDLLRIGNDLRSKASQQSREMIGDTRKRTSMKVKSNEFVSLFWDLIRIITMSAYSIVDLTNITKRSNAFSLPKRGE